MNFEMKGDFSMNNEFANDTVNETLVLMPLVDILEGNEGITMWFEVPGANSKTVNIEIKNRIMTMTAASSLRRDGQAVVFKREFQLSDGIDIEKITAKTQDGVLTLVLPKSDSAKVHKITVE